MITEKLHPAMVYCRQMNDVRDRLLAIPKSLLDKPGYRGLKELMEIEPALLSLRKVLEQIAYASLMANEQVVRQKIQENTAKGKRIDVSQMTHAKNILKEIETLNPGFFPVPALLTGRNGNNIFIVSQESKPNTLSREDFVTLYDLCSHFLHVPNPFSLNVAVNFQRSLPEWLQRIRNLLEIHQVALIGGEFGIVEMGNWDGTTAAIFHHTGPADKEIPVWGR